MQSRVRVISNDGEEIIDPKWCVTADFDTCRTLCGHALDGASDHELEEKEVMRGGITCKICLSIIREIKGIKL